MSEKPRKGPSVSAIAALLTLAISLWMEVDLADALLRAVLVFLGLSMVSMAYRIILGKFIAHSYEKAQQELLDRIQREAEAERQKQKQDSKIAKEQESKKAREQESKRGKEESELSPI